MQVPACLSYDTMVAKRVLAESEDHEEELEAERIMEEFTEQENQVKRLEDTNLVISL